MLVSHEYDVINPLPFEAYNFGAYNTSTLTDVTVSSLGI
jgi:hypothetical protein